jgi:hypothetical protein
MRDTWDRDRFALEVIYVEALLCEIKDGFPYHLVMKQRIHQAFSALENEVDSSYRAVKTLNGYGTIGRMLQIVCYDT